MTGTKRNKKEQKGTERNRKVNILIIDVGTSSMRGILYDETGNMLSKYQMKYAPVYKQNGEVSQPASQFKNCLIEICTFIAEAAENQGIRVESIAITSQRSSIIPIDNSGNPLMDAIMWQDIRNKEICQSLDNYNDILFEKTGSKVNTVFSGSKMTLVRYRYPDIYKKVYKFVNIPEYLIYIMSGEFHSDVTYGSRSGLMNYRERKWDKEILKLYQVEENHLCRLHEPGDVCTKVSGAFADMTGLPEGISVVSAGGDQQCAAIGQGAYKEGSLSIVTGTGGFMVTASDKIPDNLKMDVICNCSSVKGKYMIEASILTCCSAFDWACRNFYRKDDLNEIDYEEINEELKRNTEVSPVLVLPYFSGRSTPDWNADAKATFSRISLGSDRRDILKAVVEGICLEINNNMNSFRKYVRISRAAISGGLTKSSVINQIQADVYGIPLYHMHDSESAALGALIVALCGLGVYSSMDDAYRIIRSKDTVAEYVPDIGRHKKYIIKQQEMNELYNNIYGA